MLARSCRYCAAQLNSGVRRMGEHLIKSAKRYTELPFLLQYLQTKQLVLLSSSTWDDRNDAYYLELYTKRVQQGTTLALCLTQAPETYHHWKIFSSGSSGVLVEFDIEKLILYASKGHSIRHGKVRYKSLNEIRQSPPRLEDLPFTKRVGFQDEQEYRLLVSDPDPLKILQPIDVPLVAVDRVIFGPWLPKSVTNAVKKTIREIPGCSKLKMHQSNLTDNTQWKAVVDQV